MTFNEADVNRKEDGKFGEKTGSAPETGLENAHIRESLNEALTLLNDPSWQKFPLELQERAVAAAADPALADDDVALAEEVADACEDWNFHDTSLRISAGLGRRHHERNPDAPLENTYSMAYDPATPPELLRRLYEEKVSPYAFMSNPSVPSDILAELSESEFESVVERVASNPGLDKETHAKLAGHENWRIRHGAVTNALLTRELATKMTEDENPQIRRLAHEALEVNPI